MNVILQGDGRPYGVLEVVRTGLVAMSRKFELSVAQKNPILPAAHDEAPKAVMQLYDQGKSTARFTRPSRVSEPGLVDFPDYGPTIVARLT